MKKLLVVLLMTISSIAMSQPWFQASVEYKFNEIAGYSNSNEVGYSFNLTNNGISLSPSIDYTYFSNGLNTQTLLFQCVTLCKAAHYGEAMPYISITGARLSTFPIQQSQFGGSVQVGVGFDLSKNAQFFFQYRYFNFRPVLQGQLTQFGIQYTFGG